jgi:peptidoglycan/xylan/chitin deacetylase (PgdA/CDA1 family)
MLIRIVEGAMCAAAGAMAYAVRGRSSRLLAPSVWRGGSRRRAVALTFDDGPSESTPLLLECLERHRARATFFQCGANVRRLPGVAREVAGAGHEIGNHSDSHARLYLRSSAFIYEELSRAQETFCRLGGVSPVLFRAPYGARWFGLRDVQRRLGLLGVMWTVLGRDWVLPARGIVRRILRGARNGAIFCLHDGRELLPRPDVRATLEAVRRLVPELQERGYRFETVSELLCPKN